MRRLLAALARGTRAAGYALLLAGSALEIGCAGSADSSSYDAPTAAGTATNPTATSRPTGTTAMTSPTTRPSAPCLAKLEITQGSSLDTVPVGDGSSSDFPRVVRSEVLGAESFPDPAVAALVFDGSPIFFKPEKGVDAKGRPAITIVDATLFGELACVDATRLRPGAEEKIGAAKARAMKAGPRAVADALIRAGVIRPFVHMSASLCLVEERSDAGAWRGTYRGTHTFFTNAKNVEPVAFEVLIDAAGAISVRGLESVE